MTERMQTQTIKIKGVQKTNIGSVSDSGDVQIFEDGVIGGSVSDEFKGALNFREAFERTSDHVE